MRRYAFLFFIPLLLISALSAQNDPAALYFKLLEADDYELDLFYSSELQRLYVQVDFDIAKSSLDPAYHYGVFLSKEAQFQALTVSGNFENHYFVNNLTPQYFQPELANAGLLSVDSPVKFCGLSTDNYNAYPETAHYRLWYYLHVPPFQADERQQLSTGLGADQFWYPRSVSRNSTVKLKLTTTPYMSLLVGNSYAAQSDSEYSRIHLSTFIETPDQPNAFKLIRD